MTRIDKQQGSCKINYVHSLHFVTFHIRFKVYSLYQNIIKNNKNITV